MTRDKEITNSEDVLDVREIIERLEELESERDTLTGTIDEIAKRDGDEGKALDEAKSALATWDASDEAEEFKRISLFVDALKDGGGDHQWRGAWYPVTLVRGSYWKEYAQELAEDIGAIKDNAAWPHTCIDWDKAAWELRMDYTSAEFDGVTYWYR